MKVKGDRCGFKKGFFVPTVGYSGGLALFWDSDIVVNVLSSSPSHIDAIIEGGSKFNQWYLTGFYGTRILHKELSRGNFFTPYLPPHNCLGLSLEILMRLEELKQKRVVHLDRFNRWFDLIILLTIVG